MYEKCLYPIVYIDESGFKIEDNRPHVYAPKGQTYQEKGTFSVKQKNVIGAICGQTPFALSVFDCSITADVFYAWVIQQLIPELPAHSVVVMDNAPFHKKKDIQTALEQAGHQILWLSPYSPDFNPIEKLWSWIKYLRKVWNVNCIETLLFWFLTIVSFLGNYTIYVLAIDNNT
ncbi:IS630 family transposase [Moraxella sp. ZY21109]|nr:IS630 family transposase [Moraxella sp. ZY210820]WLF85059.1 IS630 family transposase [Moraxella sp. ZY210820]